MADGLTWERPKRSATSPATSLREPAPTFSYPTIGLLPKIRFLLLLKISERATSD